MDWRGPALQVPHSTPRAPTPLGLLCCLFSFSKSINQSDLQGGGGNLKVKPEAGRPAAGPPRPPFPRVSSLRACETRQGQARPGGHLLRSWSRDDQGLAPSMLGRPESRPGGVPGGVGGAGASGGHGTGAPTGQGWGARGRRSGWGEAAAGAPGEARGAQARPAAAAPAAPRAPPAPRARRTC